MRYIEMYVRTWEGRCAMKVRGQRCIDCRDSAIQSWREVESLPKGEEVGLVSEDSGRMLGTESDILGGSMRIRSFLRVGVWG